MILTYIYITIIGILIIPLFILMFFLWDHRKENGQLGKMRKIIGVLAVLKAFYFLNVLSTLAVFVALGYSLPVWVFLPSITCASLIAIGNWWALVKVKQIQYEQ